MQFIMTFLFFVMAVSSQPLGRKPPGSKPRGPPGGGPKTWCPKRPPKVGGECICEEICYFGDECCCGIGECVASGRFECVNKKWEVSMNTDVCDADVDDAIECSMTCDEENCDGGCLRRRCGPPN